MLASLDRPLPPSHLAAIALAAIAVLAAYCLAYNALQGAPVTLRSAIAWPVANVVPMLVGMEYARRRRGWAGRGLILAASLAAALAIGAVLAVHHYQLSFETVRRLPVILLCAATLAVLDRLGARRALIARSPCDLPVPPGSIDWVEAAANYVVLHGRGMRIIHRATLAEAETALASHGFVRIHRSRLVARRSIARVRPYDVILADGSSLATGARYRAGLEQAPRAN